MTNADYKREAHNLYNNNELFEAYHCAWQLPFTEFIKWFTDTNGKRRSNKKHTFFTNSFFYDSFLTTQPIEWLNHDEAILLWEYYLSSQYKLSLEFELYVAFNNPLLFIEGYKSKMIFFKEERIDMLEKHLLPKVVVNELKIWKKLNSLLNEKWNAVSHSIDTLSLLPHELIMCICASFESFVYQDPDDKERWHFAVETLSLLVAFIQNNYELSDVEITDTSLQSSYLKGTHNLDAISTFEHAYDYILLRHHINRYLFEPDLSVILDEHQLRFRESEIFNQQWQNDELRYTVNEQLYYAYGEELFDDLKNNNHIRFINNNESQDNQLGNTRQFAIIQYIKDLGIRKEDLKNNELPPLNFIISFLHGLAWRKLTTTELPLHKIARLRNNDYLSGTMELFKKHKIAEFILISNKNILYDAAMGTGLSCTMQEFNKLIDTFSFQRNVKTFCAFKQKDSLWQKPFIKVGSSIISPLSVFTGFTSLYTISESILKNFVPRDGTRIEQILKERYDNEIWETSIPGKNQEYGDIDVVMEDDAHLILMQFKRTYQKTDVRELHLQKSQDFKSIKQLKEASKSIDTTKTIHLWYVTTAFEKVGARDNGVLRVSYQDLLGIKRLMDSEGKLFKSLSGLIELIETDRLYELGKEHRIK
ncbi:hypothetical protein JCM19275_3161 [Nonlabens ulvanivorans]|uniref:Uncharacterized protein n=1 Tax=Nonlabens ulvanivorans TaxID=906888 RepID=A0A090WBF1_NONUL|nr:hypothetical protein [Nonlabens ulvanivorans]GAL74306.1 hypothetical protein JCM19275_3161 [Nonlabens ulvanivorans]